MDIWDSLRVLIRRWRVSLPIAVIGMLMSGTLYLAASTTWDVETSVILLGPSQSQREVDGVLVTEDLNEYFESGVAMPLTRVIVLAMKDPSVVQTLEAEGLSTDFTQEWDNRQPLINTRVSGSTEQQTIDTARRLLELTEQELNRRQTAVEAPEFERARQDELSFSQAKENFRNPRLAFGIGFALTIAATVGVALAVEWWQRREEFGAEAWVPNEPEPGAYAVVKVSSEQTVAVKASADGKSRVVAADLKGELETEEHDDTDRRAVAAGSGSSASKPSSRWRRD